MDQPSFTDSRINAQTRRAKMVEFAILSTSPPRVVEKVEYQESQSESSSQMKQLQKRNEKLQECYDMLYDEIKRYKSELGDYESISEILDDLDDMRAERDKYLRELQECEQLLNEQTQTLDIHLKSKQKQNDEEQQIQVELNQWKSNYKQLQQEYETLFQKSQNVIEQENTRFSNFEGLMHEVECWRMRYKALEDKMRDLQRSPKSDDKTINSLRLQIQKQEELIEDLQNQIKSLNQANREQVQLEIIKIRKQYEEQRQEYEAQIHDLEINISEMRMEIDVHSQERSSSSKLYDQIIQQDRVIESQNAQIAEMEKDIGILISDIQYLKNQLAKKELSHSSNSTEINVMETQYREAKMKILSLTTRIQQLEKSHSSTDELRQEVQVWRNRYLETEVRLQAYDDLKVEHDSLLHKFQQLSTKIEQLTQENRNLHIKYQEDAKKYQQAQEYQTLQISQSDNRRESHQQTQKDQEAKIKELQDKLQRATDSANGYKMQMEESRLKMSSGSDESRLLKQKVIELESATTMFKMEIERLQKIRADQELRIQQMVQRTTEQETQLNMMNSERGLFKSRGGSEYGISVLQSQIK